MCLRHLRRVSADAATTFGWVNSISAFFAHFNVGDDTGGPIKEQTRTGWSRLLLDFGMRLALSRPIDHSRNSYVPRNGAGLIFYVPVYWPGTAPALARCAAHSTWPPPAPYTFCPSPRCRPRCSRGYVVRGVSGVDRLGNPRRNTPRRDRHCPVHRCGPCNLCWSLSWSKRSHHQPERGHGTRPPYTQRRSEIRKTVAQELFDQIGLVVKEINGGGGIECPAGSPSRGVL